MIHPKDNDEPRSVAGWWVADIGIKLTAIGACYGNPFAVHRVPDGLTGLRTNIDDEERQPDGLGTNRKEVLIFSALSPPPCRLNIGEYDLYGKLESLTVQLIPE